MSLAIRWGEDNEETGGFVYLDSVTVYTQNYSGKVTKHPVDSGVNITDHFIRDNLRITLSCVISGVDISTGTYLIQDNSGNAPFNSQEAPIAVSVNSTDASVLKKFIPDSIGQFLPDSTPDVAMDPARIDLTEQIRDALVSLISGEIFNEDTGQFDPNIQLVRLFEFDKQLLKKIINRLVITNIIFKEDANSGYGLYCDITFEQVTFAYLKKTRIPSSILLKKASQKSMKGKQDSTPQDVGTGESPKETDPLRQATAVQ